MGARTTLRWIALALAGLVIAAGASLAASRLAGQHIGLASEPITAGNELAPPEDHAASRHRPAERQTRTTLQRTTPAAPATPMGRGGGDDSGGIERESDD